MMIFGWFSSGPGDQKTRSSCQIEELIDFPGPAWASSSTEPSGLHRFSGASRRRMSKNLEKTIRFPGR